MTRISPSSGRADRRLWTVRRKCSRSSWITTTTLTPTYVLRPDTFTSHSNQRESAVLLLSFHSKLMEIPIVVVAASSLDFMATHPGIARSHPCYCCRKDLIFNVVFKQTTHALDSKMDDSEPQYIMDKRLPILKWVIVTKDVCHFNLWNEQAFIAKRPKAHVKIGVFHPVHNHTLVKAAHSSEDVAPHSHEPRSE